MVIILHLQHPITEQQAAKPIPSNDPPPSTISPSTISDAGLLSDTLYHHRHPIRAHPNIDLEISDGNTIILAHFSTA
jgi:hypothetical protein